MQMNLSSIFSARNVTLVVFILVVLVLGTVFDTRVGPEGMKEVKDAKSKESFKEGASAEHNCPAGKKYDAATKTCK